MTEDAAEQPGYTPHAGNFTEGNDVASKFKPEFVGQARKLFQLGAVDHEVADFFGVDRRTLTNWRNTNPEFAAASSVGKGVADDRVEASLYHKAVGYTFDSEKIFCQEGAVVRAKTVEHVPPSDTAAMFWLKNRRRELWKDKVEHEHDAGGTLADLIRASMKPSE